MGGRKTGGGSATSSGISYQTRVSSWFAVRILSEKLASPILDLPSTITFEYLACETAQDADDFLVVTSEDGLLYGQAKTSISLSETEGSPLYKTLDQFVRQFNRVPSGSRVWDRPFDAYRDRLILATKSSSSSNVTVHLESVLRRVGNLHESQPLDDAASNDNEIKALRVVRTHVENLWQTHLSVSPTEEELKSLLSSIYVTKFDVEPDDSQERESLDQLRLSVLVNPEDSSKAWSTMVNECDRLSATKKGINRIILQRRLSKDNIELKSVFSVRSDIQKLKQLSTTSARLLKKHSSIKFNDSEIVIDRVVVEEMYLNCQEAPLLVIGDPGAGKSGSLSHLVQRFDVEKEDYLFLSADRVTAGNLQQLKSDFCLDHEILFVLENWISDKQCVLVIDALDAARDESVARTLRDLVQLVSSLENWTIIASVRKFDLRYSNELQELFKGVIETENNDGEFADIRHVNIAKLTDLELVQLKEKCSPIWELVENSSEKLKHLLKSPFNLKIGAELIDSGSTSESLSTVTTQVELLDKYWNLRIVKNDGKSEARELVISRACSAMIENMTLSSSRREIAQEDLSEHLHEVLKENVLIEWQYEETGKIDRYNIAFSHHILFDFSVAKLFLPESPEELKQLLVSHPELTVFVRPSLMIYYEKLWSCDSSRKTFWEKSLDVMSSDALPLVTKIVPANVVRDYLVNAEETDSLLRLIESGSDDIKESASQLIRHIFGTLILDKSKFGDQNFVTPWILFAHALAQIEFNRNCYSIRMVLSDFCDYIQHYTPDQYALLGEVSRTLLSFAWGKSPRDNSLVIHGIQCVCKTYCSNPEASKAVLSKGIEPAHLKEFGFAEIHWVADGIEYIIECDPEFASEMYKVYFGYEEESKDTTQMGNSQIMPLSSNRRQDYTSGLYQFAGKMDKLLHKDFRVGLQTTIDVAESYIKFRHPRGSGSQALQEFSVGVKSAGLQNDHSCIWDSGSTYKHDDGMKVVDSFTSHLRKRIAEKTLGLTAKELVDEFLDKNECAFIWRRLLKVVLEHPDFFGNNVVELLLSRPIQISADTGVDARKALKEVYPHLDDDNKRKIENWIRTVDTWTELEKEKSKNDLKQQLALTLPLNGLLVSEVQELRTEFQSEELQTDDFFKMETGWSEYGEIEYLSENGVPVEEDANKKLIELSGSVKEFSSKFLNETPTMAEIQQIYPKIVELDNTTDKSKGNVHEFQIAQTEKTVYEICERICRCQELDMNTEAGAFVLQKIVEAGSSHLPEVNPDREKGFNESISISSEPRAIAADAICYILRNKTSPDHSELFIELSRDSSSDVRYALLSRINCICESKSDLMWKVIEERIKSETSPRILSSMLSPLGRMFSLFKDQVIEAATNIFHRDFSGEAGEKMRERCVQLLSDIYLWHGVKESQNFVQLVLESKESADCRDILMQVREPLKTGSIDENDDGKSKIRKRTIETIKEIVKISSEEYSKLLDENRTKPLEGERLESAKAWGGVLDYAADQIYFSSGAFETRKKPKDEHSFNLEEKSRFYAELEELFDLLIEIGRPGLVHHLLETLGYLMEVDPRKTLFKIQNIVSSGKDYGYQYESLAADQIVKHIERYLAEYRYLFRDKDCQGALISILDTFVEAGWPKMRALTYKLETIFR